MFENVVIKVLVSVVVIILGFVLLKYLTPDKDNSPTAYAKTNINPSKKRVLKKPTKGNLKTLKMSSSASNYAPSPVDATMSEFGEWSTNRNVPTFITNVSSGFPENDEGTSDAAPTAWTMTTTPKVSVSDAYKYPTTWTTAPLSGYDSQFESSLGAADLNGTDMEL